MGTTKPASTIVARKGVNYVREIVESSNSIFHEVHQENDYGIDVHVELVEGTDVRGKMFAIQVKSGASFCTMDTFTFRGSKDHFEYWSGHSLPVLGLVYDPDEGKGYWVNLSDFIGNRPHLIEEGPYSLPFQKTEMRSFTRDIFEKIIKPQILNEKVSLPLEQARRFFRSEDYTQHRLGFDVLAADYADDLAFWQDLFLLFRDRDAFSIAEEIIYCLADVASHPEPFQFLESKLPDKLIRRIRRTVREFSIRDVAKVLEVYDEDDWVEKYPVGRSAFKVISLVSNKDELLRSITYDTQYHDYVRNASVILYGYFTQEDGVPVLEDVLSKCSGLNLDYVTDMIDSAGYEGVRLSRY